MPNESASRKAVITGGSSGIGESLIHKFYKAGYETITADIDNKKNLPGHFIKIDLTRPSQVDEFIHTARKLLGVPDLLVCNAGKGIHEKLTEGDPESWEEIFKLNVFSALRLIRAFVPEMTERKTGDIVFISSVSANRAYPYGGVYSATKAAINQLAETLRLEVQPHVRTTVIHLGVVNTNFFKNMVSGTHMVEDIGWGSLQPEQVADIIFYAISQPRDIMLNDIVLRPIAQPM